MAMHAPGATRLAVARLARWRVVFGRFNFVRGPVRDPTASVVQ